jgi:catechol 2,3-dioxygenase-like lactoylglutathione lyase family enzyme
VAPPIRARVDHVAYTVPDLDEAVAFFQAQFGWELVRRKAAGGLGEWMERELGAPRDASVEWAFLRIAPDVLLELFRWEGAGLDATRPRNCDAGGRHLGLAVERLDAAIAHLREVDGVELLGEPKRIPDGPAAGSRWIYMRTPWGMDVELIEPPVAPGDPGEA